jgi:hypothetical protein
MSFEKLMMMLTQPTLWFARADQKTAPHDVLDFFAARCWYKRIEFAAEKEA